MLTLRARPIDVEEAIARLAEAADLLDDPIVVYRPRRDTDEVLDAIDEALGVEPEHHQQHRHVETTLPRLIPDRGGWVPAPITRERTPNV